MAKVDGDTISTIIIKNASNQTLGALGLTDEDGSSAAAISELVHNICITNPISLDWQSKTINGTSGIESNSTTRISAVQFLASPGFPVTITPGSGMRFSIRYYTSASASSIIGTTDWYTEEETFNIESAYFKIVVSYTNDATIDITAGSNMSIVYTQYTDKELVMPGKAADAKAVNDRLLSLKDDLDQIAPETEIAVTWIQGTIDSHTGSGGTGVSRIHTTDYYYLESGAVTVSAPNTMKFGIRVYADAVWDSYIEEESSTIWYYGTVRFSVQRGRYIRFVAAYTSDGNIAPEAGANVSLIYRKSVQDLHEDIVSRNDPDSMLVKLQQLNRPTRTASRTLAQQPLCLIHFSDIHGDAKCLKNVLDFQNHYSDWIADIIHTGDMVTTEYSDGIAFWNNTAGAERILNCIGNHDTRANNTWIGKTMDESYTTYFAPFINNWGVTYTANKTYYYKDYPDNHVRLIVLDIMHQTSEQLSWFTSTLNSARSGGLHVIVACHSRAHWLFDSLSTPWDDKIVVPGYAAGYSDSSGGSYPENMSNSYANAVDSFISAGGEFICWIHGHTHFKMAAKLHDHPNQLDISVSNAGGTEYAWTYVCARFKSSKSEDDFNVLAIDTYSKVLRIVKVGVDYDRYMRHTDTFCYNYGTREMITG
jgi:Predicted phosphohydrolases